MTITEFLLDRITEDEEDARTAIDDDPDWLHVGRGQIIQGDAPGFATTSGLTGLRRWNIGDHIARWDPTRVQAECAAKRAIIEFHESWPVLTETRPTLDPVGSSDINTMTYRLSQQIQWLTTREYVAKFGSEPPTAPMLKAIAAVYADHPDYNKGWA